MTSTGRPYAILYVIGLPPVVALSVSTCEADGLSARVLVSGLVTLPTTGTQMQILPAGCEHASVPQRTLKYSRPTRR